MASSSAITTATVSKCILCGTPGKSCSSCNSTYYCGLECQQTDWPLHKHLCKKLKDFPRRPSPSHKLGLLFPSESTAPELIWVEHETMTLANDDNSFENPLVKPFLGPAWGGGSEVSFNRGFVYQNNYRYTELDHTLVTYCRDTYFQDGSRLNRAIVAATNGKAPMEWKGPIVVLSQDGTPQDPYPIAKDITLGDLRTVVDYFLVYGDPKYQYTPFDENSDLEAKMDKLKLESKPRKGCRLNCGGDLRLTRKKFLDVNVQRDHPIYSQQPTSVTKVMGMPLLVRKYPPAKAWKDDRASHDNQSATFLNLSADINSPEFGWAPPEWQSYVGSVLVVRQDGKDIDAKQGFAIAEFCQHYLQERFENTFESDNPKRARVKMVQDHICQAAFERYLESDGHTWRDVASPYHT